MHDAIDLRDLIDNELVQLRETGHDITEARRRLESATPQELEPLYDDLARLPRDPGWKYEEPTAWEDIEATLSPATAGERAKVDPDKVHAAWLGRVAGNMLGKPVEDGDHWTPEHLRSYLELADAWPLTDYFPMLDPMPAGYDMRGCWVDTTRGNVDGSSRDDDVDYTILGVHLLETYGPRLTTQDVADQWLLLLPWHQTYTAERVAYRNLALGLKPPDTASYRNPYREWIGAQIRGDAFGYVHPGDPVAAAKLAYVDAAVSHVANGIYGEMWAAALVAAAFTASTAREAIEASLQVVPPRSRQAEAITDVLDLHRQGVTWEEARHQIGERYGHYGWVHTMNNAAVVAAGLLWGDGDFTESIALTVLGGLDTDSNGGTAGSVAGILAGTKGIPSQWTDPLHDRLRSALFGFDGSSISDLAQRTVRLAERFGTS